MSGFPNPITWLADKTLGHVGGAAGNAKQAPNDQIVLDPTTGLYVDKNTGAHYTDKYGSSGGQLRTPTAADLVTGTNARSDSFFGAAPGYATREGQAYGQQQDLADAYRRAISGATPSVAQTQLGIGLDQAQKQQLSAASGGTGVNAALAQRFAAQQGSNMAAQTNQQSALMRASEDASNRSGLGSLLGTMNNESAGMWGGNVNAGLTSANQALTGEMGREHLNTQADTANSKNRTDLLGSLTGGGGQGLMAALSDRRAKQNVSRKSLADALADNVHGVTFDYKPEFGGSKHFGVIAQDVEKVIPGAVKKRPDGLREISAPELSTANTAVISELASRLRKLEGKATR